MLWTSIITIFHILLVQLEKSANRSKLNWLNNEISIVYYRFIGIKAQWYPLKWIQGSLICDDGFAFGFNSKYVRLELNVTVLFFLLQRLIMLHHGIDVHQFTKMLNTCGE